MIQISNENIMINGKKEILFGGEMHYFRVPQTEWRNRIRQIKAAGGNLVSTYVPWIFHEIEEGTVDLTGKTRPERNLQSFLQIIKEEKMYCLVRPGPYVMAELVNHGVPRWFNENYPEAMAKTQTGEKHPTGVVSYLHPVFLEKVSNWYQHVCEIIAPFQIVNDGSVIMFQLDNEVGMLHWVTNQGDYNEVTLQSFISYLKERYSLDEFMAVYGDNANSIEEFVRTKVKVVEKSYAIALQNDYGLFMREYYRHYIEFLKSLAKKNGICVPFVVNIHGFDTYDGILKRGTKYPIGVSQLLETAKIENVIMAGDYYIGNIEYDNFIDIVLANTITKAIQTKDQPLFSAEFQGGSISDKPRLQPSTFDLTTRICFANGMNAINYYMFVSGENNENIGLFGKRHEWQAPLSITGKERAQYPVIQHLGKMFQTFSDSLSNAKLEHNTHMAFYPDYYMTEFSNPYSKAMHNQIEVQRDLFWFNGIAKGLTVSNVSYEGYNLLEQGNINVENIPTLWVFATKWMDPYVQEKLVYYVQNGGKLILFPTIPTESMKGNPCTLLRDFIGLKMGTTYQNRFITIEEMDNIPAQFIQTFQNVEGAFAWIDNKTDEIVAFDKPIGAGKVIAFGVGMHLEFDYQLKVIKKLTNRLGVQSSFILDENISAVNAFARIAANGSKFIFIHNFDEYSKETTITFHGQRLFHGKSIELPGKSGLVLPIQVELTEDLFIISGTGEIFSCQRENHYISLKVRKVQKEEVFIFKSESFVPQITAGVSVEVCSDNIYKVTIHSTSVTEKISFWKKV
ncbi:beta-galactosidase [Bacillaceae bacterium Marseille-Q3522]|nr:beta-galactosidase [Bacillaceae bacterium Marseille-Q3522]